MDRWVRKSAGNLACPRHRIERGWSSLPLAKRSTPNLHTAPALGNWPAHLFSHGKGVRSGRLREITHAWAIPGGHHDGNDGALPLQNACSAMLSCGVAVEQLRVIDRGANQAHQPSAKRPAQEQIEQTDDQCIRMSAPSCYQSRRHVADAKPDADQQEREGGNCKIQH